MNGSTLRCSFGSIQSSALKAPSEVPRGIAQAILQARSETSKASTFAAPLVPARSRFQVTSVPQPSGVTMPRPVTTTLRIAISSMRERGCASSRSGRALLEELDGFADGDDGFRGVVGDLHIEFLLERHHELDGVEAV